MKISNFTVAAQTHFMRFFITGFIISLLLFSCDENQSTTTSLGGHLPVESQIIISTAAVSDLTTMTSQHTLLETLSNLERFRKLSEASEFLKSYEFTDNGLIALSTEGKNNIATTILIAAQEFENSSLDTLETKTYNNLKYYKDTTATSTYYFTSKDAIHIATSSKLVVESFLRRDMADYQFDNQFNNIYEKTNTNETQFYIKSNNADWLPQFIYNKTVTDNGNDADWLQLEIDYDKEVLQLDGILTYRDSLKQHHEFFNKLTAQENRIAQIAPSNSNAVAAITYSVNDEAVQAFINNDAFKLDPIYEEMLLNANEIATITTNNNTSTVFSLLPYETLFIDLDSMSTARFNYRDVSIYELKTPIKSPTIPYVSNKQDYSHVILIDQFIVLGTSATAAESIIANYQNKTVLYEREWYKNTAQQLSSSSSLLLIKSLTTYQKESIKNASKKDAQVLKTLKTSDYPASITQLIHEDEYAHLHIIIPSGNNGAGNTGVQQIASYKVAGDITAGPFLFPNHKTKSYDVAFQDEDYRLYLISNKGKKYWSRDLNAPIIGEITATDVYKNGRKQLAFNTTEAVYLLDRNGKNVNAFPISFKQITQPLSVFDYDNRRDYRFLVTAGDRLHMYNRDGIKVKGFNYQAKNNISSQPMHCRVGTKDYIAFTKNDNSLMLLNRTGKIRTPVKESISLKSDLFFNNNKLTALTTTGEQISINLSTGKISTKTLDTKASHFIASNKTQILQEANNLVINDKVVELPYGTYSNVQLHTAGKREYISTIEQGDNKVYLFNDMGVLINSFPVYGKKTVDVVSGNKNYMVTTDGGDIIIYQF